MVCVTGGQLNKAKEIKQNAGKANLKRSRRMERSRFPRTASQAGTTSAPADLSHAFRSELHPSAWNSHRPVASPLGKKRLTM